MMTEALPDSTVLTEKNVQEWQPLYTHISEILKADPGVGYTPKEIATNLHANPATIRKECIRLSQAGKGVVKDGYGRYQWAPEKERVPLRDLVRSGQWKVENLTFVTRATLEAPPIKSGKPKNMQ